MCRTKTSFMNLVLTHLSPRLYASPLILSTSGNRHLWQLHFPAIFFFLDFIVVWSPTEGKRMTQGPIVGKRIDRISVMHRRSLVNARKRQEGKTELCSTLALKYNSFEECQSITTPMECRYESSENAIIIICNQFGGKSIMSYFV